MRRILSVIALALAGLGLLAYPSVATYLSDVNGSYASESYNEFVEEVDQETLDAEWQEAVQYNESLSGNPVHDPFIEGTGMAMQDNYYDVLDLGNAMGTVEIPKISVSLPIYHGTTEDTLQQGIGHLEGSSMPIGGEGTHAVLTGHTGLAHARMFTDLSELEEGDLFYVHVLDRTLAYRVDQILVVEPEDSEALRRVKGKDYCTLLTCTPYGINSHRLLVRGERTDYIPEEKEGIEAVTGSSAPFAIALTAAVTTVAVVIVVTAITVRSRRNERRRQAVIDLILGGGSQEGGST